MLTANIRDTKDSASGSVKDSVQVRLNWLGRWSWTRRRWNAGHFAAFGYEEEWLDVMGWDKIPTPGSSSSGVLFDTSRSRRSSSFLPVINATTSLHIKY